MERAVAAADRLVALADMPERRAMNRAAVDAYGHQASATDEISRNML